MRAACMCHSIFRHPHRTETPLLILFLIVILILFRCWNLTGTAGIKITIKNKIKTAPWLRRLHANVTITHFSPCPV
jgi:hypothetical protein